MSKLKQIWIDARGMFTGAGEGEITKLPMPKNGVPRCEIITLDGRVWPFADARELRKCLEHQAKLPGAFPLSDVAWLMDWALNNSTVHRQQLEKPRLRNRDHWRETVDWMNGVVP